MKFLLIVLSTLVLGGCAVAPAYQVAESAPTSSIKVVGSSWLFIYQNPEDCSDRYQVQLDSSNSAAIKSGEQVALTAYLMIPGTAYCPISLRFTPDQNSDYEFFIRLKNENQCQASLLEVSNSQYQPVESVEYLEWNEGFTNKSSWCTANAN